MRRIIRSIEIRDFMLYSAAESKAANQAENKAENKAESKRKVKRKVSGKYAAVDMIRRII